MAMLNNQMVLQFPFAIAQVRLDSAGGFDHTQRWIVLQCCEVRE